MKMVKSFLTMAIVLGAFITTVSTAVYASTWEKGNGSDLYGLPHVTQVHSDMGFAKLDFGNETYGLPQVTQGHNANMAWAKVDFGEDLYGLPYAGSFHKM